MATGRVDASPAGTAGPGGGRDWWVICGLSVTAVSAAVASFTGLRGLAELAGWPHAMAVLLPLTVDAYAVTATRVWLVASAPGGRARRFARANALGAIAASLVGNATYHAITAGVVGMSWPIVVVVGAAPAAALGLLSHLVALRGQDDESETAARAAGTERGMAPGASRTAGRTGTGTPPRTGTPRRSGSGDARTNGARARPRPGVGGVNGVDPVRADLVRTARLVDADYRARTGRPMTRDALRSALGVSTGRATQVLRHLRSENGQLSEPSPTPSSPAPDPAVR